MKNSLHWNIDKYFALNWLAHRYNYPRQLQARIARAGLDIAIAIAASTIIVRSHRTEAQS